MIQLKQISDTASLNYDEIEKDLQRITQIKPFINKYNWEWIEKKTIVLDVLFVKRRKIYPDYVWKYN